MAKTKKITVAVPLDVAAEDAYWRENYLSRPYVTAGAKYDAYQPAYARAVEVSARRPGERFEDVEEEVRREYETMQGKGKGKTKVALPWEQARLAAQDAWDRTIQLREEQLRVEKSSVQTGAAKVRKEVVTERKTIEVPVEREEVVIERRPVNRRAAKGETIKAEEIRIPVTKDQVHVTKETVVKEEVGIKKRKVKGTQTVSADVSREELEVEEEGTATVQGNVPATKRSRKK